MTTAVLLAFGGATTGALAQEPETPTTSVEQPPSNEPSTPTSTTDTAPPTSTDPAPPSSTDPAPPSSTEPSTPGNEPSTPSSTPASTSPGTPAPAQPKDTEARKAEAELPDVKIVAASLDKAEYESHEQVRVTMTLTNLSSVDAEGVRGSMSGLVIEPEAWGDFRVGKGGRLAAGETRTIEVPGSIATIGTFELIHVSGSVQAAAGDANDADNGFYTTAKVTRTFGSVSGVVFGDDGDGMPEHGEMIEGGIVTVYGGSPLAEHRTTTDENGQFAFKNIPAGKYNSYYELPGGWVVHRAGGEPFTVSPGHTAFLNGRAERPHSETLTASVALDRQTYGYPAKARISLTIKNVSGTSVEGIKAACGRSGDSGELGRGFSSSDLRLDGTGVTLAPGESRSFEIVEDVPEAALTKGVVLLDCGVGPHPEWNHDGPQVSGSAAVRAGAGSFRATVIHDKNSNWWVDAGEQIAGLKFRLKDQQTGAVVAERTTGADGKIEFAGLQIGNYWAVADGDWKFLDGTSAWPVHITEQGADTTFYLLPGKGVPSLRGALRFEKPRYESHEDVRLWLTVTNIGGQTAERVRLDWPLYDLEVPAEQWGDFRPQGPGIQLADGDSRTFEVTGKIRDLRDGKLNLSGTLDYLGRPNPHNSGFSGSVEVVQTKGDVTGVVYTDKNRNGQLDAGEAAADVVVDAYGGAPSGSHRTTTDSEGRFSFKGIPSGDYWINYTLADGWVVHTEAGTQIRVLPNAPVQLTARAERPYSESLSATLTLDKDTYAVGEEARITITLTNSSDRAISGIQAGCNRIGDSNHLGGAPGNPTPTGWGELLPPGKGVTVGAGETKTFVAVENVPAAARVFGKVVASCDFAPSPGYNSDGAYASDTAAVPGGFGSVKGELFHDRNGNWTLDQGEAIGNTRIVLRDERAADIAEAFSDDQGKVSFVNVPAGDYQVRIDGPWKFEGEYGAWVRVFADGESSMSFIVVPVLAPEHGGGSTPPAQVAPAGGAGGSGDALAKTGASVLGLGLLGALLVAFGFGASVIGRRRQIV